MVSRCRNCLNLSTRPRIIFDKRGWCNACCWNEEKKQLDWSKRKIKLNELLENSVSSSGYNCIVPVSGGKDGSYVSYQLKEIYKAKPLAVTIRPPLEMELGKKNLNNFVESGYDHLHITPNQEVMRQINKIGFVEKGFPYYGFLVAIHTAVLRVAHNFDINLIFYGEDGEVEYGGTTETKNDPIYNVDYQRKIYLEAGYEKVLKQVSADKEDLYFFTFPDEKKVKDVQITHWSYFENWDPYRNYLIAKEHCGLEENENTNEGTFTNFAQNDQYLYALHTYMMYMKFGFGRATQDAGIEIRRGAMSRGQGINLVNLYDNYYPEDYIPYYLDYFQIKKEEFDNIIDKWANKSLFEKNKGKWMPSFETN